MDNFLNKIKHVDILPAAEKNLQMEDIWNHNPNRISNINAVKYSTNTENKIAFTNDNGYVSKEDIDLMVKEAERYKNEDERRNSAILAKNALECYCFDVKNILEDTLKEFNETIAGLNGIQVSEKAVYEYKRKELENVCNLVIDNLRQEADTASAGPFPDGTYLQAPSSNLYKRRCRTNHLNVNDYITSHQQNLLHNVGSKPWLSELSLPTH
ncbi:heat shock 70 kDa protein cognate 4-like isoform X1 [Rhynchophorus ferrugineus]|uniref:heat shock 70 kDa protein cognate 4-like isoform X1 n=1 Tax=Rhynchophorus ferrugineus TaxID=354439 RepID=UPI003FCD5BD9